MLVGAITALIVLAVIYGYVAMRPAPPIDVDLGPDRQSFTVATPPDEAFKVTEALPVAAPYKLARADAAKRRVMLSDGMTAGSYGYFYTVDIAPSGPGSEITVNNKSKYPFQFGPFVRKQRDTMRQRLVDALAAKLAGKA